MIISGEKGAAAVAASPFMPGLRVETTPLGSFKGTTDINGDVTSLDFKFSLPPIPYSILAEIIAIFRADLGKENIVQIYWNKEKGYYLQQPDYEATKQRVRYLLPRNRDVLVMTVHSHNTMKAFFSPIDDEDELYTGLFGVIGRLDRNIDMTFRAGMEGCFKKISAGSLFGEAA